ncbi:MAG: response regulator [Micavibrio aeruginosavorus]|nr:response regulator [Micavibrio aeruginosavorus]
MNTPVKQRAQITYSLKNFTILLAEDYEFMQNLIGGMLRAFGVGNIMVCGSGREAIELLQITESQTRSGNIKGIDLILADWMMPEGSGLELIDWVRNHKSDRIRFTPIILVSAFTSEDVVIAARDHGANEALVKPVSGEKVAARILSVIDTPRPFVKTSTFFGPDRRRKDRPFPGEDRRKMTATQIITHDERL